MDGREMGMEANKLLIGFEDLWKPDSALPGKAVLRAIAIRCGYAWGIPDLAARVRIAYDRRLRTSAGIAHLDDRRVALNPRLLGENPAELVPTLVHELAHIVVYMRHGRVRPHGREFRGLMDAVNMPAHATHSLSADHLRAKRRRYLYLHRCRGCGYSFISRKVRRNYYCIACGPKMTWKIWRAPATKEGRRQLNVLKREQAPTT